MYWKLVILCFNIMLVVLWRTEAIWNRSYKANFHGTCKCLCCLRTVGESKKGMGPSSRCCFLELITRSKRDIDAFFKPKISVWMNLHISFSPISPWICESIVLFLFVFYLVYIPIFCYSSMPWFQWFLVLYNTVIGFIYQSFRNVWYT